MVWETILGNPAEEHVLAPRTDWLVLMLPEFSSESERTEATGQAGISLGRGW